MRRLNLALAVATLLLGLLLTWQWSTWKGPLGGAAAPAAAAQGAQAAAVEVTARAALEPFENYSEVVERVLFVESRRPPPPVAESSEGGEGEVDQGAPGSKGRPQLRLTGLVLHAAEPLFALVEDAGGARLRLAPGDEYQGWRVSSLAPGRLVLAKRGRNETYLLREFVGAASAPATVSDRRRSKRVRPPKRERP